MKWRDVTVTGAPATAEDPSDALTTGEADERVDADEARSQIRRIVSSPAFAQAPRSRRMLEYVAEATISGQERDLTESVLAVELFGRDGSFDPGSDSIVRANARRLREKLDAYYASDGQGDAVLVEMPKGHYRLTFHDNTANAPGTGNWIRAAVTVGLLGLVAVAAIWLWQRDPDEPSDATVGVQAPLTAIAVLPFDDLSPTGDNAWLANGMAEDLIESLRRIEGLNVPARRSTAILKESGADLLTIGDRLHVGSVVEGSVRRFGDQLSVVARWIRASDGTHLWSARFDRQLDDFLVIQKEITVAIAEAIRVELGIQDAPRWALGQRYVTSDVRAWELVTKAVLLIDTGEPDKVMQARDLLLLAVQYDPDFAEAWARLAWIDYITGDIKGGVDGLGDALRMDPSNVTALRGLAYDSAARLWDYETAEWLLDHIPLTQKTSWVLELEFHVNAYTGRLDEALQAAERAIRFDPMWARAHCYVGFVHDWAGDSALALQAYERAFSVAKETNQFAGMSCNWDLIRIYLTLGRESEVEAIALSTPWISPHWEAIRRGWESGGWEGMNLAFDDDIPPDGDPLGRSCRYEPLALAGASERLYECLESEFEATAVEVPASDLLQTFRRLVMAQNLAKAKLVYASYLAEPQLQDLLSRIEKRISAAAGSYKSQVDLRFLR